MYRLITVVFYLFLFVRAASAQMVVSEVLPNPGGSLPQAEWIELYNSGDQTVNLKGYAVQGRPVLQDLLILPKDYLVITRSLEQFTSRYQFLGHRSELNISLPNDGGIVELKDPNQNVVDSFSYTATPLKDRSWQKFPDQSISRHCYSHSVGKVNEPSCPQIEFSIGKDWSNKLELVGAQEVMFRLSSYQSISQVSWRVGSENIVGTEVKFAPEPSGQLIVSALVTSFENEVELNSTGLTVWPKVELSEVDQDWVELFLPSTVNLSGWVIRVDSRELISLSGTTAGYAVFTVPKASSASRQFELIAPSGFIISSATVATSPSHWAKYSSGWSSNAPNTKGLPNDFSGYTVSITEAYPVPGSDEEEWLELYNFGSEEVAANTLRLTDGQKTVTVNQPLPPNTHIVVSSTLSLNNTGDSIRLLGVNDLLVDKFAYGKTDPAIAWARAWNGKNYEQLVQQTLKPTPGDQNVIYTSLDMPSIAIIDARQQDLGSEVTIEGHISTPSGLLPKDNFYMQDNTAGILVKCQLDVLVGKGIKVIGKVRKANGEVYLLCSDYRTTSKLNLLPLPVKSSGDLVAGKLVTLQGEVLKRSTSSFTFAYGQSQIKILGKIDATSAQTIIGIFAPQEEVELIRLIESSELTKPAILPVNLSLDREIELRGRPLQTQLVSIPNAAIFGSLVSLLGLILIFLNKSRYLFIFIKLRKLFQTQTLVNRHLAHTGSAQPNQHRG